MLYIDNENYLPLLAVTYAVKTNSGQKAKKLFEEYVTKVPYEKIKELFDVHEFCKSLTITEYRNYQFFYGLCVINKDFNFPELDIKIEKLYRDIFGDIYKIVRRNKQLRRNRQAATIAQRNECIEKFCVPR